MLVGPVDIRVHLRNDVTNGCLKRIRIGSVEAGPRKVSAFVVL